MTSHAHVTFEEFGLHTPELAALGNQPNERIFRRDCLEIDVTVGGKPLTIYSLHFKSMGSPRNGLDGREATMPIRIAEALAVRRIIEDALRQGSRRREALGDLRRPQRLPPARRDRRRCAWRLRLRGGRRGAVEPRCAACRRAFAKTSSNGGRSSTAGRSTTRAGPQERHLCQLDYILLSPALAAANAKAVPDIVRDGQPWRTIFPPGQEVERFPRAGWDRPKASDHCPVAVTLDLV